MVGAYNGAIPAVLSSYVRVLLARIVHVEAQHAASFASVGQPAAPRELRRGAEPDGRRPAHRTLRARMSAATADGAPEERPRGRGPVLADDAGQRRAAVRGPADGRALRAADVRQRAGGVGGRARVLPGRAPARLPLRPRLLEPARPAPRARAARRPAAAARDRAAARRARGDRRRLDREPGVGAARPAHGVDRPAVLRRLLDRPAAAALARAHRPSGRARPVLPVPGEQLRQRDRAGVVSAAGRAAAGARRPGAAVDVGLRRARRAAAGLRRVSSGGRARARSWRRRRRPTSR